MREIVIGELLETRIICPNSILLYKNEMNHYFFLKKKLNNFIIYKNHHIFKTKTI